jgi:hypothetical protein
MVARHIAGLLENDRRSKLPKTSDDDRSINTSTRFYITLVVRFHAFMMLGITRKRSSRRPDEKQPRLTYGSNVDDKVTLSNALDSALSSVFRTSLILSQVDSRFEALKLEPAPSTESDRSNFLNKSNDLIINTRVPSIENSHITNWLTNLDIDGKVPPNTTGWQSNDNLLDEILSSYEESVMSTDNDCLTLPETPVSMQSSYSKLPSVSSSYSMDSFQSDQKHDCPALETPDEDFLSLKPFAGRNSILKLNKKTQDRLSNSSATELKGIPFSLRCRVKSLSIGKNQWRKLNLETEDISAAATAYNTSEDKNTLDANRSSLKSTSDSHSYTKQLNAMKARCSQCAYIENTITTETPLTEHPKAIETVEIGLDEAQVFSPPIPYSLPKECDIHESGTGTYPKEENRMKEMHMKYSSTAYEADFYERTMVTENEIDQATLLSFVGIQQSALSSSWTANNVFEYYFTPEVRATNKTMKESTYHWSQKRRVVTERIIDLKTGAFDSGNGSTENEYEYEVMQRVRLDSYLVKTDKTVNSTNGMKLLSAHDYPLCPPNICCHSSGIVVGETEAYPAEIVSAYFGMG